MIDKKTLKTKLSEKLGIKNSNALPYIEKVVINVGAGAGASDKKYLEEVTNTLSVISGQKPVITKAKKAISGFKIREGDKIGAMVTLRGTRMYSFLDRLINIALPRIRDFRGLGLKHFDKQGNYTFAIKEQVVFPEISYDDVQHTHGMQITIKINNSDRKKSRVLLEEIGMPFEKNSEVKNG